MYKFWQLHFKMVDEMSCLAFVFNSLDRPTGITDLFYKRDLVYTEAFTYQCAREREREMKMSQPKAWVRLILQLNASLTLGLLES